MSSFLDHLMRTSSHMYDTYTTDEEDTLFQFFRSNRTLYNFSFFILSFLIWSYIFTQSLVSLF